MRTKKLLTIFLSAAMTITMALPVFASADSTITPTFDDLLAMSKEEICALSEEMPAVYEEAEGAYKYIKVYQVSQQLNFYDDAYREKPRDLFRDAGLPDELIGSCGEWSEQIISVDEEGNVIDSNGGISFEYDYSSFTEYDEEKVFIAGYLTLITSPLISYLGHDFVAGWDTPATTPSTTETTTTDTTPDSTITPTFDDLLAMSKEEICALSEEMPAVYEEAEKAYRPFENGGFYIQHLVLYEEFEWYEDIIALLDLPILDTDAFGSMTNFVTFNPDGSENHLYSYVIDPDYTSYQDYDEKTVFIGSYIWLSTHPHVERLYPEYIMGEGSETTAETTTTDTTPDSTTLPPETTTASTTASATTAASTTTTAAASGAASSPKTGDGSMAAILAGCAAALAGCVLCGKNRKD